MRFPIRIDAIWRLPLLILGATPSNSYVEIAGAEIHLRFGVALNRSIARDNVVSAAGSSWRLINGVGIIAGGSTFGIIGSTGGVVELVLRDPVRLRFVGWAHGVHRIAISLEDPQAFIDALAIAAAASAPDAPDPAPG